MLSTVSGGTAVIFNDVETLKQTSPGSKYVSHMHDMFPFFLTCQLRDLFIWCIPIILYGGIRFLGSVARQLCEQTILKGNGLTWRHAVISDTRDTLSEYMFGSRG